MTCISIVLCDKLSVGKILSLDKSVPNTDSRLLLRISLSKGSLFLVETAAREVSIGVRSAWLRCGITAARLNLQKELQCP